MEKWIQESNRIEEIYDPAEDERSLLAWKWFKRQDLSIRSILALHKRITWKQLDKEAGKFRSCQVWVGGREGAPWSAVPELMAGWLKQCYIPCHPGDKGSSAEWIKMLHVAFEKIHPFIDGNGRTGRMILNWQRVSVGLEPLLIEADKRGDYYQWFIENDAINVHVPKPPEAHWNLPSQGAMVQNYADLDL